MSNTRIGLTEIRGLYASNSPYIYGDPSTLPVTGQSWTPNLFRCCRPLSRASTAGTAGTISLSATPQTGSSTGLLLTIDTGANQEYMRVKGVSGLTVTVERGSSTMPGTTPPSHIAGAAITISSRWSWASGGSNPLSRWGGGNGQFVKF